jgi:hypothetical protein
MIDPRAELLIDELATHPQDTSFDFAYWRTRFQTLFALPIDPSSREALMDVYAKMLDGMERSLASSGGDVEMFRNARETDWRALCLQEAQLLNPDGYILPRDISEIIQREVNSGRMQESEYTRFIQESVSILPNHPDLKRERKGFWSRLFGQ